MLNDKTILITGGTGSFGKMFTKTLLKDYPEIKKIMDILQEQKVNKFNLVTGLRGE